MKKRRVGDIVTVLEEGKSNRGTWKLGRVKDIHPGKDDCVTGATVDVSSSGKLVLFRRPLAKLFPLEIRTDGVDEDVPVKPSPEREKRPKRKAAEEGELRRRIINQRCDELDDTLDH